MSKKVKRKDNPAYTRDPVPHITQEELPNWLRYLKEKNVTVHGRPLNDCQCLSCSANRRFFRHHWRPHVIV